MLEGVKSTGKKGGDHVQGRQASGIRGRSHSGGCLGRGCQSLSNSALDPGHGLRDSPEVEVVIADHVWNDLHSGGLCPTDTDRHCVLT
jgi:hypothetical protein